MNRYEFYEEDVMYKSVSDLFNKFDAFEQMTSILRIKKSLIFHPLIIIISYSYSASHDLERTRQLHKSVDLNSFVS